MLNECSLPSAPLSSGGNRERPDLPYGSSGQISQSEKMLVDTVSVVCVVVRGQLWEPGRTVAQQPYLKELKLPVVIFITGHMGEACEWVLTPNFSLCSGTKARTPPLSFLPFGFFQSEIPRATHAV